MNIIINTIAWFSKTLTPYWPVMYKLKERKTQNVTSRTLMKKSSSSWLRELSTSLIFVVIAKENSSLWTSNSSKLTHFKGLAKQILTFASTIVDIQCQGVDDVLQPLNKMLIRQTPSQRMIENLPTQTKRNKLSLEHKILTYLEVGVYLKLGSMSISLSPNMMVCLLASYHFQM